jgi:TatD DNase family protein
MITDLVDFHCHLDLFPDMDLAVRDTDAAGIYTLAVTTTPKAWPRNRELAHNTRYIRAALGLHPQLVAERAAEITLWEEYLPESRYIGEVGLDAGPQYYRSFELQQQIFTRILQTCAKHEGKILSVHSVRSAKTVLDLVEEYFPVERGQIVLHWFTGSQAEVRRAVDLGCYFSVNHAMLQNDRARNLVLTMPLHRLLTETDGPFTRIEGRPTRPHDVIQTVKALSKLRQVQTPKMAETIRANLRTLLASAEA